MKWREEAKRGKWTGDGGDDITGLGSMEGNSVCEMVDLEGGERRVT